jgi:hypothetical protein
MTLMDLISKVEMEDNEEIGIGILSSSIKGSLFALRE